MMRSTSNKCPKNEIIRKSADDSIEESFCIPSDCAHTIKWCSSDPPGRPKGPEEHSRTRGAAKRTGGHRTAGGLWRTMMRQGPPDAGKTMYLIPKVIPMITNVFVNAMPTPRPGLAIKLWKHLKTLSVLLPNENLVLILGLPTLIRLIGWNSLRIMVICYEGCGLHRGLVTTNLNPYSLTWVAIKTPLEIFDPTVPSPYLQAMVSDGHFKCPHLYPQNLKNCWM